LIDLSYLPEYNDKNLCDIVSELRNMVFNSQGEAANFVGLNQSQINRFENDEYSESNPVSQGYIACLIIKIAEVYQATSSDRESLLAYFNTIKRAKDLIPTLKSWDEIEQIAYGCFEENLLLKAPGKAKATRGRLHERLGDINHHDFIASPDKFDDLLGRLTGENAPWIITLSGLGGSGKNVLCKAVAHHIVEENLFDDVCWLSLASSNSFLQSDAGHDTATIHTENICTVMLNQLVPSLCHNPLFMQENFQDLLQRRLRHLPHLVVISNIQSITVLNKLISELARFTNPTKFVFISRVEAEQSYISQMRLKDLSLEMSIALMRSEAQALRVDRIMSTDDQSLADIYRHVGGNPRVLCMIVEKARTLPMDTILSHLDELRDQQGRTIFDLTYRDCWEYLQPQERQVWLSLLLSTHHGVDLPYLAAINRLDPEALLTILVRLYEFNLLNHNHGDITDEIVYEIHTLTRTYLQNLIDSSATMERQFIEFTGRAIVYLTEYQTSFKTFEPREQALYSLIILTGLEEAELCQRALDLLVAVAPKMEQSGVRESWVSVLSQGIYVSQTSRRRDVEGELYLHLGTLHHRQAQYEEGNKAFADSAEIFADLADYENYARGVNRRAFIIRLQQNLDLAQDLAHFALKLLSRDEIEPRNREEEAYSYLVLGTV